MEEEIQSLKEELEDSKEIWYKKWWQDSKINMVVEIEELIEKINIMNWAEIRISLSYCLDLIKSDLNNLIHKKIKK